MSERTSYTVGTPCWVDLSSPDLEASIDFYGALLGWDVPGPENEEQTGGYRQAMKNGEPAAGMMPLMQEGQPPAWTTYIAVEDANATAARVAEAGGTAIAEPMDVTDLGRMAIFADPTGAVFGVWQPGTFPGAGVVNEPGGFSWNELGTRDPSTARDFYARVFSWGTVESEMGEMGVYSEWMLGERAVAGMLDLDGRLPDETRARWLTYFVVEDAEAAIETVKEKGGSLSSGPLDTPVGRAAVVQDPHGAALAVIKPTEAADAG